MNIFDQFSWDTPLIASWIVAIVFIAGFALALTFILNRETSTIAKAAHVVTGLGVGLAVAGAVSILIDYNERWHSVAIAKADAWYTADIVWSSQTPTVKMAFSFAGALIFVFGLMLEFAIWRTRTMTADMAFEDYKAMERSRDQKTNTVQHDARVTDRLTVRPVGRDLSGFRAFTKN